MDAGRDASLLALDLDRAFRDPLDLRDLIDTVENAPHQIVVDSCTDSLHLEKGRDNFDAEIRVLVANKASRDTARRVAAARERQARNGQFGGGRRPFGFCLGAPAVPAGSSADEYVCPWHGGRDCKAGVTTIDYEIAVIADCSRRLLEGVSLRALAAELRAGEVPTVTGANWTTAVLRTILLRARNAGFMVHQGKILDGVTAPWEPIVSPDMFTAVERLLTDPSRKSAPGAPPRWHGTGIYRCGVCVPPGAQPDTGMTVGGHVVGALNVTMAGRQPRYQCREGKHLTRNAAHVDRWVFAHVLYALTHPRAYELLAAPAPEVDALALRAERAAIRARLEQMAEDEVLGLKTRAQVIAATRRGNARIAEIDEELNVSLVSDPMAAVVQAADPVAAWEALPLADQRLFIDRLCTVTILPTGRRGSGFDPASVLIEPKHGLGAPPFESVGRSV